MSERARAHPVCVVCAHPPPNHRPTPQARAYRVLLTHFSTRYPKMPSLDLSAHPQMGIAMDFMSINLADLQASGEAPAAAQAASEMPASGQEAVGAATHPWMESTQPDTPLHPTCCSGCRLSRLRWRRSSAAKRMSGRGRRRRPADGYVRGCCCAAWLAGSI